MLHDLHREDDVDEALRYLARDAKSEVTLNTGGNNARERAIALLRRTHRCDAYQTRQSSGIVLFACSAAREADRQQRTDQQGDEQF